MQDSSWRHSDLHAFLYAPRRSGRRGEGCFPPDGHRRPGLRAALAARLFETRLDLLAGATARLADVAQCRAPCAPRALGAAQRAFEMAGRCQGAKSVRPVDRSFQRSSTRATASPSWMARGRSTPRRRPTRRQQVIKTGFLRHPRSPSPAGRCARCDPYAPPLGDRYAETGGPRHFRRVHADPRVRRRPGRAPSSRPVVGQRHDRVPPTTGSRREAPRRGARLARTHGREKQAAHRRKPFKDAATTRVSLLRAATAGSRRLAQGIGPGPQPDEQIAGHQFAIPPPPTPTPRESLVPALFVHGTREQQDIGYQNPSRRVSSRSATASRGSSDLAALRTRAVRAAPLVVTPEVCRPAPTPTTNGGRGTDPEAKKHPSSACCWWTSNPRHPSGQHGALRQDLQHAFLRHVRVTAKNVGAVNTAGRSHRCARRERVMGGTDGTWSGVDLSRYLSAVWRPKP